MTTFIEQPRPELAVHSQSEADLIVDPSDISFHDLDKERVLIRVRVRNGGTQRSKRTFIRLQSAPLGAFVPWRPLAVLPVPPLEPGESRELSCEAAASHPAALGSFDRLPPKTVLTAVDAAPDEPAPQPGAGLTAMLELFRRARTDRMPAKSAPAKGPSLAPDLWDLVGREQPHWAGNINVFIGTQAVERHMANALRIYPGRPNLAMFLVGGLGIPDAYAFGIEGLPSGWQAALYDVTTAKTLVVGASDASIPEREWVETDGPLMIMLAVRPPAVCEEGNVKVQVTRRSNETSAVVEFNLDPTSQGPGCYAV